MVEAPMASIGVVVQYLSGMVGVDPHVCASKAHIAWVYGLALLCTYVLRHVVFFLFKTVAHHTQNRWDDVVEAMIQCAVSPLVVALFTAMGVAWSWEHRYAADWLLCSAILSVLFYAARAAEIGLKFAATDGEPDERRAVAIQKQVSPFVRSFRVIMICAAITFLLDHHGCDVLTFLTGLGVGGLAVGMAATEVVGDLWAALALFVDRPFCVGDAVMIDGVGGTVLRVGLRSVVLRAWTGETAIFNNALVAHNKVLNYTGMSVVQQKDFRIRISKNISMTTLENFPDLIRTTLDGCHPKYQWVIAYLKELSCNAFEFEVRYTVTCDDAMLGMEIQGAINNRLHKRFEEEGITIPPPLKSVSSA